MRETENENPFGRSGHGRDGTSSDPHALLLHQLEVKMDELERSAAALRASENRFRTAFESSAIGLVIMDVDGIYLRVNQAFSRMLGYMEEELIGRNYEEFTHPDDRAQNRATMHEFLRGERTGAELEKRFLRNDGSIVWATMGAHLLFDDHGAPTSFVTYVQDISRRREAEEALRLHSAALSAAANAIIITDRNGAIIWCNPAFERHSGYSAVEVLQQHPRMFKSGAHDAVFYEQLWSTILSGRVWEGEIENRRKDGTTFPEEMTITPVLDKTGQITHFVAVKKDVTMEKANHRELVAARDSALRSEKLKDAFIANISHEIRTPLNIITGYAHVVSDLYASNAGPVERKYFESIQRGSERLMRTVDEILSYSRLETEDVKQTLEHVDLGVIVGQIVVDARRAATKKGLSVTYTQSCKYPTLMADAYYVTQAISNIVDNAVKYTHEGSLDLELGEDAHGGLVVNIRDTGIGIAEDYLPHLFDPYSQEEVGYSRAYEGIGLGLALVKRYLALVGATVSVRSAKGIGTTFTLRFGIGTTAAASTAGIAGPQFREDTGKPIVLLVDDDEDTVEYCTYLLQRSFTLRSAQSAAQAREVLGAHDVALVLMDISLRGGTNGLQLTRELRGDARHARLPIIAVTAHAFEKDRQDCLDAGCTAYVTKPIDAIPFRALVARLASMSGTAG